MGTYRLTGSTPRVLFHRLYQPGEQLNLDESQAAQVEAIEPGALVRIDPGPDVEIGLEEEAPAEPEPTPAPEEVEASAEPLAEPVDVAPDEPPMAIRPVRYKRSRK